MTTTPPIADAPAEQVVLGEHTFTVRPLQPADRTDALALHERVFGPGADPAWHAWKYGRLNGEGHGVAMGAWRGTEMVAHCGGVPRTLHLGDRAMPGMQVGDVMVAPRWRGLLTRRGPFYQVSQAFYGRGWLVEGTRQVAFGFPNERHLKLALALKLVWNGGPVLGLEWTAGSDVPPPARWWRWAPLDPSEPDFDRTVSRAWLSMRAASGHLGLGQRDAPYVRWRFLHRPGQHCQLYALRRPWSSRAEGIAVLKKASDEQMTWLDWIGSPDLMPVAAVACRREAARQGCRRLTAWASPAVRNHLDGTGIAAQGTAAWLSVARASGMTEAEVSGTAWWWMGGDTDFL